MSQDGCRHQVAFARIQALHLATVEMASGPPTRGAGPVSPDRPHETGDNPNRQFDSAGLSFKEVELRKKRYGPNVMARAAHPPLWHRLLSQLVHFFAIMLWIAGGLAILAGMPQLGFAIFVVIVLNGLFSFLQEYRAEKAAEKLLDLLPRRVTVRRGGTRQSIDAIGVVPDDVVILDPGDRVSA